MSRASILLAVLAVASCAASRPVSAEPVAAAPSLVPGDFPAYPIEDDRSPTERADERALRVSDSAEAILRASLWLSGVTSPAKVDAGVKLARTMFDAIAKRIPQGSADARARALLEELHAGALRKYDLAQTRTDTLLETGTYNCVSSAVVYVAFARWLGLPAGGIVRPSHALAWVDVGGARVEVETTSRNGYRPDRKSKEYREFLRSLALDPDAPGEIVRVPAASLVARIATNRIALGKEVHQDDESETGLHKLLVISRQVLAVVDDAVVSRNVIVYGEALAQAAANRGAPTEAWKLQRTAIALAKGDPPALARTKANLLVHALALLGRVVEADRLADLEPLLAHTRASLDCGLEAEHCAKLDQAVLVKLWNAALDASNRARPQQEWAATQAVLERFPAARGSQNHAFFVIREVHRRWEVDHEAADALLVAERARARCGSVKAVACAQFAEAGTEHWFDLDVPRALAWVRLAFAESPADEAIRGNYGALLQNAAVHAEGQCDRIVPLAQEGARAGVATDGLREAAQGCAP